jgi:nucleoside-triphosphatase THEP1
MIFKRKHNYYISYFYKNCFVSGFGASVIDKKGRFASFDVMDLEDKIRKALERKGEEYKNVQPTIISITKL